jgi:class 3 adenylate cyclase
MSDGHQDHVYSRRFSATPPLPEDQRGLARTDALDEIQEFLASVRPAPEPDRVLATPLFTDIVGSTDCAAQPGNQRWHALLDQHHRLVREQLARFRGPAVDTVGDGFFATFAR